MNSGKIKEAWSARLGRITGCAQAVSDCHEWTEGGESGYTLTVPVSTELTHHYLTSCVDILARDANRRVEVHPGPGPGLLAVRVWNDAPIHGTCGAQSRIEPDGFNAYCDRDPFHEDPVDDDHSVNQHHAMIRSRFGDEPQGEHFWGVGPLHVVPESPYGIVAVLEELAGAERGKERVPDPSTDEPWTSEPNTEDAHRQIAERLVAQLVFFGVPSAQARAEELMDQAAQDIEHTRQITRLRCSLHRDLTEAVSGTLGAIGTLEQLASDGVYDVEYAGTRNAADVFRFVDEARRSLAAAVALLPTDEKREPEVSTVDERPVTAGVSSKVSLDQSRPEGRAIAKAFRAAVGDALPGDPWVGDAAGALGGLVSEFGVDPNGPASQVDQAGGRTWVQTLPDAELLAVLADATTEFTARAEQALAEQVRGVIAAYYELEVVRVTFTVPRGQRTFTGQGAVLHRADGREICDHLPCVEDDLDHFSLLHKPVPGARLEVVLAPEGDSVTYHPPGAAPLRVL